MALPTEEEYIEVLFKLQKFVVVSGHAEQVGIAPEVEAYRFNVKMPLEVDMDADSFKKYCDECFNDSVAIAKTMWGWIKDVNRAGRNLGWAVVTLQGPGVVEWNNDYKTLEKQDDRDIDAMEILWMLIQQRLADLEAIREFADDQVATFKARAVDWLSKTAKK